MLNALRKLLDPTLGAKVRAVLRVLGAIAGLGALAAGADLVAGIITALQGVLAILVATPTTPPTPPQEN